MQVIEVRNNLVRISYDSAQEELLLSGFLAIKDETSPQTNQFIGQIMHLEANTKGTFAIVKLLFNFDSTGVVLGYNGSIPSTKSTISYVETQGLLGLLPIQKPVVIGELAQQKTILKLDESLFKDKLVVFAEKEEDKKLLAKNINAQLIKSRGKVLVFDLLGDFDFSQNKVVASEDFKLPLNYETINFIYEKGLDAAKPETKALIQEVFLEVQKYVKTLPEGFIPFESFKNVVDEQYKELGIVELVLLKNKLLKYWEDGVFAQDKEQFDSLENSLTDKETTILDLSKVEGKIQREIISYTYSLINKLGLEIFVLVNVDNSNSDKKLLKQIYTTKTAYSTVICSYSYKYLTELKQLAKDLILFAPINQQNDFASYNTFLNKLNSDEFIIYGNSTHSLPLIVNLDETPQELFEKAEVPEEVEEIYEEAEIPAVTYEEKFEESPEIFYDETQEQDEIQPEASEIEFTEVLPEDFLDEQIKKDVDGFYMAPKQDYKAQQEAMLVDDLTDNDLDFIDDLNIVQDEEPAQDDVFTQPIQNNTEDDFDDSFFEEPDEAIFGQENTVMQPQTDDFSAEIVEEDYSDDLEDEFPDENSNITASVVREEPQTIDILPARDASIPSVPIYPAEIEESGFEPEPLEQGDTVSHAKYGKGTVEKMISYGSKTLCSIHFDNVGRRLLDPSLTEIKKV